MPPANTHMTADQRSILVEEASIATHHGGGTGDADGRTRGCKARRATGVQGTTIADSPPPRGKLRRRLQRRS